MKKIRTRSHINPGSKSVTHRALIAAGLAQGESLLEEFLACEDTLYTISALRELGVQISTEGEKTTVSGSGGKFSPATGRKDIFLGNSGTSYRLLLSIVALARGEYTLTGSPRMNERPIGDLVRALNNLGVEATCIDQENCPPVLIKGKGIHGGKVEILVAKAVSMSLRSSYQPLTPKKTWRSVSREHWFPGHTWISPLM
jgi:3-phosphoshikimate 1-carboxyvinyltransferase